MAAWVTNVFAKEGGLLRRQFDNVSFLWVNNASTSFFTHFYSINFIYTAYFATNYFIFTSYMKYFCLWRVTIVTAFRDHPLTTLWLSFTTSNFRLLLYLFHQTCLTFWVFLFWTVGWDQSIWWGWCKLLTWQAWWTLGRVKKSWF